MMEIGERYLFMTATHYVAGTFMGSDTDNYEVEDASLVFETGEFPANCDGEKWTAKEALPAGRQRDLEHHRALADVVAPVAAAKAPPKRRTA